MNKTIIDISLLEDIIKKLSEKEDVEILNQLEDVMSAQSQVEYMVMERKVKYYDIMKMYTSGRRVDKDVEVCTIMRFQSKDPIVSLEGLLEPFVVSKDVTVH